MKTRLAHVAYNAICFKLASSRCGLRLDEIFLRCWICILHKLLRFLQFVVDHHCFMHVDNGLRNANIPAALK